MAQVLVDPAKKRAELIIFPAVFFPVLVFLRLAFFAAGGTHALLLILVEDQDSRYSCCRRGT